LQQVLVAALLGALLSVNSALILKLALGTLWAPHSKALSAKGFAFVGFRSQWPQSSMEWLQWNGFSGMASVEWLQLGIASVAFAEIKLRLSEIKLADLQGLALA
jgi:hypothetical protein